MRNSDIQVFSTSFLDLLSCGMAAVIVLCFVFAAQSSSEGEIEGDGTVIIIRSNARLGIRFTTTRGTTLVGHGPVESNPILVAPWGHGVNEYRLVIDETQVTPADKIEVFLAEFIPAVAEPSSSALLEVTVFNKIKPDPKKYQMGVKPQEPSREWNLHTLLEQ